MNLNMSVTNKLFIDNQEHTVTISLFDYENIEITEDYDMIEIKIEELATKLQYQNTFSLKDINELTVSKFPLNPEKFFKILIAALLKEDNNMELVGKMTTENKIIFELTWNIPNEINLKLPLIFLLNIYLITQDDTIRLDKVNRDLNHKITMAEIKLTELQHTTNILDKCVINMSHYVHSLDSRVNSEEFKITNNYKELFDKTTLGLSTLQNEINTLSINQRSLSNKITNKLSNIINKNIFIYQERKDLYDINIKYRLNKKSTSSILLIKGELHIHGNINDDIYPCITYGNMNNKQTSVDAIRFSVISNTLLFTVLLKGHNISGLQDLTLTFDKDEILPATVIINPNNKDNVRVSQTWSTIEVEEIENIF
jgi:hypothetical protein